jgi:Zn-dependent protease with chaperone function
VQIFSRGFNLDWLSSHPDTGERIARLRAREFAVH